MRAESRSLAGRAAGFMLAVLAGCGGGDDAPTPPDLSGVWAGAWQGNDPKLGFVSGTWDIEITQGTSTASGPGVLLGDIDCMDGQMQTNPGNQGEVTGAFTRAPCGTLSWTLTALNTTTGSAAGSWKNALTFGSGTLSGSRIAQLGGPRIEFMHPPGAKPGAIVTLSGQTLVGLSGADTLFFNGTPQSTMLSANVTRIVARVPVGATTGAVQLTTSVGVALSPRLFSTDVISPPVALGGSTTPGVAPAALAVSPDGRKFYVADRGNKTVRVVRASTLVNLNSVTVAGGIPRSVVASPNGKRIYVAAAGLGVLIMDAATAFLLDTISLPTINDGGRDNPQGLAISSDGTLLLVSDGANGGSVSLLRISNKSLVRSVPFTAGIAPLGVAFSPDGSRVYIAAADLSGAVGTLNVFDTATGASIDSDPVGVLPTGIAVSPDGNLVYVSNQGSGTVSIYNTLGSAVALPVTVGTLPTGIAISPDGARVYVANRGSNNISVIDTTTGGAAPFSPLAVGTAPIAVAINPQGTMAYVSNVIASPVVVEIGGMRTLTVALAGSGIGSVRSNPPGIDCGTLCQAQFPANTNVDLVTFQDSRTILTWSGDNADCSDGNVTLNANMYCVATFEKLDQSGGDCFIATAAYGSSMAGEVVTLRRFRDHHLMKSEAGRGFVRLYYRYSPAVAEYIRERDSLRAAVRWGLWPVVSVIKHPAPAMGMALVLALLIIRIRRASG